MAYQSRILESQSALYIGIPRYKLARSYPNDLGLFFESTTKPNFTPVIEGGQLVRWFLANRKDPVKEFPFPKELANLYTWANTQVLKQGIVPVRAEVLSPDEEKCASFAKPYVLFGTDDARNHLLAFVRKVADSRVCVEKGPQHIGELLRDPLVFSK